MPFSARAGAALGGERGVAGHDLSPQAVRTVSTCSLVSACVQCTECGLPLPLPSSGSTTARRRWVWNSCPSVRQYRRRHVATPRLHISTTVRRPGHTTPLASSLFDDLCTVVQSRRPLTDELTSASYPPSEATWPGTRSRWVLSSHSFRPPLARYTNFSVPATLWIGCSPDAIQFFLLTLFSSGNHLQCTQ
ncbi:uncharacterized protein LOC125520545 [Triticum urartu]|uniref:uncharacterized protein LOC125520545 n=1 Tax=Triticum urartu TaxID=4572 RepID=UPI002044539B|nr:uncharacterized protein LOC125520545 [Triticum urartu]